MQAEVIDAVMANRDVFVKMPTGSGKSLCFQLPAIASNGVTIVISPLNSLIEDQIEKLKELQVELLKLFLYLNFKNFLVLSKFRYLALIYVEN